MENNPKSYFASGFESFSTFLITAIKSCPSLQHSRARGVHPDNWAGFPPPKTSQANVRHQQRYEQDTRSRLFKYSAFVWPVRFSLPRLASLESSDAPAQRRDGTRGSRVQGCGRHLHPYLGSERQKHPSCASYCSQTSLWLQFLEPAPITACWQRKGGNRGGPARGIVHRCLKCQLLNASKFSFSVPLMKGIPSLSPSYVHSSKFYLIL